MVRSSEDQYKERMALYYDRKNDVRDKEAVLPGKAVRVNTDDEKTWETTGVIKAQVPPRSCIVAAEKDAYRGNTRHIARDQS